MKRLKLNDFKSKNLKNDANSEDLKNDEQAARERLLGQVLGHCHHNGNGHHHHGGGSTSQV